MQACQTIRIRRVRNHLLTACVATLLTFVSCADSSKAPPASELQPPCVSYLAELQQAVGRARSQMPVMTRTAEATAKRVVDGGKIYAGGSQTEFGRELVGRSGGLMSILLLPDDLNVGPKDVVLYPARSALSDDDRLRISRMRQAGT